MDEPSAPVVDPELTKRLAAGEDPVEVIVHFRAAPADEVLATLRLRRDPAGGAGRLSRKAILEVAARPDVFHVQAAPPESRPDLPREIERDLAERIAADPARLQSVVVALTAPVAGEELQRLGLAGEGTLLTAMLDGETIQRVARHPAVEQVRLMPEARLD